MNVAQLLSGSHGQMFASSCIIVILLLMLMMSLRLYFNRRKKAYLSLIIALMLIIAQHGLNIYIAIGSEPAGLLIGEISQFIQSVSFIMMNMAIYQLYNPTKRRATSYFILFMFVALLIGAAHYIDAMRTETSYSGIGQSLYLFVLIGIAYMIVTPFIGQHGKYRTALVLYTAGHGAYVANMHMYQAGNPALSIAEHVLPVLYYTFMFLILFDRVVELMQAVYRSSITDGLTSLYNRRFFYNRTAHHISLQGKTSVIFCDIDNFKKLNDTQGHHKADGVLKLVASIIAEETEGIGIPGRYGGEELVALLTDPKADAAKVAESIRSRVESESIVTISVGYSTYKAGLTAEELIKQADAAMYESKTTGKNKVTGYSAKKKKENAG